MNITDPPSRDIIASLGYLCLGSRLKRLGERLQSGVALHLQARGIAVQPGQITVLQAICAEGPLTVGGLSDRLGISQPGVSRSVLALERLGMVAVVTREGDKRERDVTCTQAGQALMSDLAASLFPAIESAVEDLCLEAGKDLLRQLDNLDDGLARIPLRDRIATRLESRTDG